MHRQIAQTRLILIGSITIITGSFWVGSELYFRFKTDPITQDVREYVMPLTPQLQSRALDQLETKIQLSIDLNQPLVNINLPVNGDLDLLINSGEFSPFQTSPLETTENNSSENVEESSDEESNFEESN